MNTYTFDINCTVLYSARIKLEANTEREAYELANQEAFMLYEGEYDNFETIDTEEYLVSEVESE